MELTSNEFGRGFPSDTSFSKSPCHPCQSRKRRCGKELPECALCNRTGRRCDYTKISASKFNKLTPTTSGSSQSAVSNDFPVAYFLDHQVFENCQLKIHTPQLSLPYGLLSVVKTSESIKHVADQFFTSVHLWLPIVSRSKFYGSVLLHAPPKDADLAVLVVSMKLVLPQHDNSQTLRRIYGQVKNQLVQLEQSGCLTLTMLQAMIIVAVYERGHGIYPAAYLSIGSCARYAVALGLDKTIFKWDNDFSRWLSLEEQHRAWWAILILERSMNVNWPNRPLCTPDPAENHYLPLSDECWNNGTNSSGAPYTVSSPCAENMGKFARLAQASYLLSRVLRHVSDAAIDKDFLREEKETLERALHSLLSLTVSEEEMYGVAYCSPVAVLGSALLMLHSFYRPRHDMKAYPTAGNRFLVDMERTAQVTMPIVHRLRSCEAQFPSPLVIDWMYQSAVMFTDLEQQKPPFYTDCVNSITKTMRNLTYLWPVGNFYLDLLETRRLTNMQMR